MIEALPASFYDRPVVDVAVDLVGCVLHVGEGSGVIVETEAYHHSEPACHAYVGLTARTSTLFATPGSAYVYRSYGVHALLNAVCEGEDVGAAVLVRALEPLTGVGAMHTRRGRPKVEDLCSGPGKLTQALGLDLEANATSLIGGPVRITGRHPDWKDPEIIAGPRIGITRAVELPWRFCAVGSRSVSRPWPPGLATALRRTG